MHRSQSSRAPGNAHHHRCAHAVTNRQPRRRCRNDNQLRRRAIVYTNGDDDKRCTHATHAIARPLRIVAAWQCSSRAPLREHVQCALSTPSPLARRSFITNATDAMELLFSLPQRAKMERSTVRLMVSRCGVRRVVRSHRRRASATAAVCMSYLATVVTRRKRRAITTGIA